MRKKMEANRGHLLPLHVDLNWHNSWTNFVTWCFKTAPAICVCLFVLLLTLTDLLIALARYIDMH